ncbi:MAG: hypothetical protein ACKOB4_12110, partial [Acidobacteriota bacterium]
PQVQNRGADWSSALSDSMAIPAIAQSLSSIQQEFSTLTSRLEQTDVMTPAAGRQTMTMINMVLINLSITVWNLADRIDDGQSAFHSLPPITNHHNIAELDADRRHC